MYDYEHIKQEEKPENLKTPHTWTVYTLLANSYSKHSYNVNCLPEVPFPFECSLLCCQVANRSMKEDGERKMDEKRKEKQQCND